MGDRAATLWLTAGMLLVAAGAGVDLVLDAPLRLTSGHVIFEIALFAVTLSMGVALWWGWRAASQEGARLRRALDHRSQDRDEWQRRAQRHLRGLGSVISEQLDAWELTPSEREVALLLLKGHTHRQAAALTDRSERTVRQHAVAVYRKSGLGGRAELAAFFLGDLILPSDSEDVEEPVGE